MLVLLFFIYLIYFNVEGAHAHAGLQANNRNSVIGTLFVNAFLFSYGCTLRSVVMNGIRNGAIIRYKRDG